MEMARMRISPLFPSDQHNHEFTQHKSLIAPYVYTNFSPQMLFGHMASNLAAPQALNANDSIASIQGDVQGYSEDDLQMQKMQEVISIVVPIIFTLIVIIGLFGNALVVIVVLCNPTMRSTTNLLIINLAIADLLFIVFCVPFTAWDYAFPHWVFGDIWCRLVQYLIVVCAYASIYTLVLMSLDRFLAVVHPIASISIRTQQNAYIAIVLTWITILIFCLPAYFTHGENMYSEVDNVTGETHNYTQCQPNNQIIDLQWYQLTFFFTSYIIPIAIVFIFYVQMLNRLWHGSVAGHMSSEAVRSKKRVTRLVVVVVLVFAGSWFPIQIVLLLKSFDWWTVDALHLTIQIISHVLAYCNSCVNPILYAFLSDNFRKAFFKVIGCSANIHDLGPIGGPSTRIPPQSEMAPTTMRATAAPGGVEVVAEQIEMSVVRSPNRPKSINGNV